MSAGRTLYASLDDGVHSDSGDDRGALEEQPIELLDTDKDETVVNSGQDDGTHRGPVHAPGPAPDTHPSNDYRGENLQLDAAGKEGVCLLYTSDAADDLLCVDLGGRR